MEDRKDESLKIKEGKKPKYIKIIIRIDVLFILPFHPSNDSGLKKSLTFTWDVVKNKLKKQQNQIVKQDIMILIYKSS